MTLAISSIYLLTSLLHDEGNPLLLIPLLFLSNTYFFWGELNYILGLSLLFFYSGYLFRRIHRADQINWWLLAAIFIGLFFCHFLPFAMALLITLVLFLSESQLIFCDRWLLPWRHLSDSQSGTRLSDCCYRLLADLFGCSGPLISWRDVLSPRSLPSRSFFHGWESRLRE